MRSIASILSFCLLAGGTLPAQGPAAVPSAPNVNFPAPLGSAQTSQFPYSMSGQLVFSSGDTTYQGSGTVVYNRSVLTAAHNLWDAEQGWSYGAEFNRARSGRTVAQKTPAARLFVLGGYQAAARRFGADSAQAFAYDLGGIRFNTAPAGGSFAGWKADLQLLRSDAYNICLGYGAELHRGDELLFVEPGRAFVKASGAFFENFSLSFEGGMSGGPVFAEVPDGSLRVVGVVVAGSTEPPAGGIRAIDQAAAKFISTYLRY